MLLPSWAPSVPATCALRKVGAAGEGQERRRGRRRGGAGSRPDGKAQSAASRVLAPNSVGWGWGVEKR